MKPIRFVCGTRVSYDDFATGTALGRSLSLSRYAHPPELVVFDNNTEGLSAIYNLAIAQARDEPAILVFIHDDLHIPDFFLIDRIREGLTHFDIIGLAGNTRRIPRQPAWCFADESFSLETGEFLSGVVGHGSGFPCQNVSFYGPAGRQCKLLDGVLLAVDSDTLQRTGLTFDERFTFDFYDVDFCRQAELRGLRMGTFALSTIHESGGGFNSPRWRDAYVRYLHKYGE
ncbi:glycosyltransferase [Paraburkholderia phymatum]|uniref:Glycosyltransferase n=1 Tax=Paraburkholderia phymatum TaxID=148447 RepID=A0ACC6U8F4_9BURK